MSSSSSEVEELRAQLEAARLEAAREKARSAAYASEIRNLKEQNLSAHNKVEQEEEFITNNLMKKLEKMNSEKREMMMRVEQEEEFLTNSLQKRLDRVLREKAELESQMAREHEQASGGVARVSHPHHTTLHTTPLHSFAPTPPRVRIKPAFCCSNTFQASPTTPPRLNCTG